MTISRSGWWVLPSSEGLIGVASAGVDKMKTWIDALRRWLSL